MFVVVAVLSISISLALPRIYQGKVQLLPPRSGGGGGAAALLTQVGGNLGGLGALAGLGGSNRSTADLYVDLLKSRTVSDAIVRRFNLKELYDVKTFTAARAKLEGVSGIRSTKTGMVIVEVEDRDPSRAASLANAYVEELVKLNQTLALTEAAERRVFFDRQVTQAKGALTESEIALRQAQAKAGIATLDIQGRAMVEMSARLQAQVASREVQLLSMRSYATDTNPDLVKVQQELGALRSQLARLEQDRAGAPEGLVKGGKSEVGLEYVRRFRDFKYREVVFELLARQLELARLDESRDASQVQVVDSAEVPERSIKPMRSIIVLLSLFIAMVATAVFVLKRAPAANG